jgi:hypothetical protein
LWPIYWVSFIYNIEPWDERWWVWKDLEGGDNGLLDELTQYITRRAQEQPNTSSVKVAAVLGGFRCGVTATVSRSVEQIFVSSGRATWIYAKLIFFPLALCFHSWKGEGWRIKRNRTRYPCSCVNKITASLLLTRNLVGIRQVRF